MALLKKAFAHLNLQKPMFLFLSHIFISLSPLIAALQIITSFQTVTPPTDCTHNVQTVFSNRDSQTISGNSRWPYDHITFLSSAAYSISLYYQEVFKCVNLSHSLYRGNRFQQQTDTMSCCVWVALSVAFSISAWDWLPTPPPPVHLRHVVNSENNHTVHHWTAMCKRKKKTLCHPQGSWWERKYSKHFKVWGTILL